MKIAYIIFKSLCFGEVSYRAESAEHGIYFADTTISRLAKFLRRQNKDLRNVSIDNRKPHDILHDENGVPYRCKDLSPEEYADFAKQYSKQSKKAIRCKE